MYHFPMQTLEQIAIVKITIALWNRNSYDISGMGLDRKWHFYLYSVERKVPDLLVPKSLENKVLNLVGTIGTELRNLEIFKKIFPQGVPRRKTLNKLCWTSQGTVDKRRTAENLIKYESLDIKLRFQIAIIYCLDNDILTLWNKLPVSDRERFYSVEDPGCVKQLELLDFWIYYIKDKVDSIETSLCERNPYQYAFQTAAVSGNKVATEYFLKKLTTEEREESLVKYAAEVAYLRNDYTPRKYNFYPKTNFAGVLCFLLSQMCEKQQAELYERCPCDVLRCFLDWPNHSFFMKTAIRMWDILPPKDFFDLLYYIVRIKIKCTDYNYQELFKEFWQQSSITHKRYVIEWNCKHPSIIMCLINFEMPEMIKEIFDFANTAEKENIFLSVGLKCTCERLIYGYRWVKVKLFVQECLSSKDILIKFKDMMKQMKDGNTKRTRGSIWDDYQCHITVDEEKEKCANLFQLLDDLIEKSDQKRSLEEVNSGNRHCSSTSESRNSSIMRSVNHIT